MKYEIRDVVSDYGVFEDDKLVLICNSKINAAIICAILQKDKENLNFNAKDFINTVDEVTVEDFLLLGRYVKEC